MLRTIICNKKFLIYLIFLLLSLAPFLWYSRQFFNTFTYIGSADFISPIDIKDLFFYRSFVYNPFLYGGIDVGFLIPSAFPENTMYYISNLIHLTPFVASLLYVSIIIFLAEISMYYFILYALEIQLNLEIKYKHFFALIAGIIYGFSPYLMGLLPPGHFRQLIPYSLFPFLLIIYDKILKTKRFSFRSFIYLFLLFLFSAGAFGNIGIIYVFLLTLAIYTFLSIVINRLSIIKGASSFFYVVLTLIISNIWWILSYINSFKQLANPEAKLSSSNLAIGLAVRNASVLNFFLGKAEGQVYSYGSYLINNIYPMVFVLLSIFLVIAIIKLHKNRFILTLSIMSLFGIFISKGPREPFGELFMWLYNNIFGFQIFRRPVSKYYGIFMFFFLSLSFIGIAILTYKLTFKKFLFFVALPLSAVAIYFIVIFIKTPSFVPFNIPDYYFEARQYLIKENVKKVLILPGLYGLQPTYNSSVNNLYATDFLFSIWDFPFDSPVGTNFASKYQKEIINLIIKKAIDMENICTPLKNAGISHIMVRQDLSRSGNTQLENTPESLLQIFDKNKLIDHKKRFYNAKSSKGFTIYTVNKKCSSNLIQLVNDDPVNIDYQIVNPTKIKVSISNIKERVAIKFLNIFRSSWNIYLSKYSNDFFIKNEQLNINTYPNKKIFFEGDEISLLWKRSFPENFHTSKTSFTNEWKIDPNYIKNSYSDNYYKTNEDGSINIEFIIYYKTQSLFYVGLILFFILSLSIFISSILYRKP